MSKEIRGSIDYYSHVRMFKMQSRIEDKRQKLFLPKEWLNHVKEGMSSS